MKRTVLLFFLTIAASLVAKCQTNAATKLSIVIDPGHGGRDSATRGGNILKKNLVLDIAKEVRIKLVQDGFNVKMTRDDDSYIPLSERAATQGDIFISIHANAVADSIGPSVRSMIKGMEIYVPLEPDNRTILLAKTLEQKLRLLNGISVRGIKKKSLAVLEARKSTAVLIELGFLSNEEDLAFLTNKENQVLIAQVFADGIKDFIKR